ncbi:MAG: efflux RND transporter permease subunit [Elusimicrobiota bacterium]
MIEFFLKRRVLTNLITFFIVVVGTWQSLKVRREAFPDIDFDIVTIVTALPGASPEEVETLVTRKVEDTLRGLSGIDRVESYSLENQSLVVLRLDENLSDREKDKVVNEVFQAAGRVEDLPSLADKPLVKEMTSSRPLISLSVAGGSDDDRDRFAEVLEDLIEEIDGVSEVVEEGDRKKEILIEVDRARLAAARLSMAEVAAALRGRNVDRSAGAVRAGPFENWVRVKGAVFTAEEVGSVVVRSNDERGAIRIADLGRVREGFAEHRIMSRAAGKPSIELRVSKHKRGDTVTLARAVKRLKAEQEARAREKGIELVLSDDISFFIERRLKVMTNNLISGGFLVLAALFIFLDWRLAAVAAWGVPISFAAAMLVSVPLGFTINLLSLLGFIIVLGMLDDDSVVVAENIYRHLEMGKSPAVAAVEGAREVVLPVLGSVLVSSCAFLPFALMSGIMGKFLLMIPLIVVMCFAASIFEAFFILPSHVIDLLPYGKPVSESKDGRWYLAVVSGYRATLRWVIGHRLRFLGLVGLFLAFTAGLAYARIKFVLFPPGLIEQFFVEVEMPAGTNLDATAKAVARIEAAVAALPKGELDVMTGKVGVKGYEETQRFGTHYGQVRVFLTPEEKRGRKSAAIIEDLRRRLADPGAAAKVTFEEVQPGPPTGRAVVVRVRGRDPAVNRVILGEIKSELASIAGVRDIKDSIEDGKRQWRVVPDPRETAFAGLDASRIADELFFAVDGIEAAKIHRPDEEVDVRLRLLDAQRGDPRELLSLDVLNPQGRAVRLSRVARIEETRGAPFLQRFNFKPAYTVTADVDVEKTTSREANRRIAEKFKDLSRRHPGYELVFGGEEEETRKSMDSLFRAFGVALLLDFVILAALFRSYAQPLIILLTIPIGLLGVTYALLVHGQPASFMALLGVVAMSGVVLNNAIVLVNFINEKREAGLPAADAACEAGAERLRPIWASSLTTLLGLFPTAYGFGGLEPFVAPMALSLAWGLTFAMPMTLFLIPVAYVTLDDAARWARKFFPAGRRPGSS